MQPETPMMAQGRTTTLALAQNRVLRNTYLLLALSMLPTIAGAWLGVATGFSFFAGSPVLGIVLFLAVAFGFMFAINKTKDSAVGVAVLLAFTFVAARALAHVRKQRELTRTLDRRRDLVLMPAARARDTARPDLAAVGDELPQGGDVLVIDELHLVAAVLAGLPASAAPSGLAITPARRPAALLCHCLKPL